MHELVARLGYRLARHSGGHLVYEHDDQEQLILPATPSDWRARANHLAEIKRRHPAAFERRRSERQLTKKQRAARASRRASRTPLRIADVPRPEAPTIEITEIPDPGSPDAVAEGCICPVFANRHGLGIEGSDGIFEMVVGCPVHEIASVTPPEPEQPAPKQSRCACGNPIKQNATGRPRKFCLSCRPSQWSALTEEQKEKRRAEYRRWYDRKQRKAA